MDKHTEELFKKLDEMYYLNKREIKEEIKDLLKNNREELKLNYNFYMDLHKKLFNVIKREDILNGQSVKYGTALELQTEGKSFLDNFENKIVKSPQTQKKETLIKNTVELWRKHFYG